MSLSLKPTHATVKAYYETLHQFGQLYIDHEGAVRSAFQTLLAKCGQRTDPKLTLVPEYRIKRARGSTVILDGALVDLYKLPHGYWEAKDEKDDLAKEVQRKLDKGYPSDNTIFQAPERAILYQGGTRIFDEDITRPEALVSVVNQFFEYKAPNIQEWLTAVNEFSDRVPELSQQVESLIKEERRRNPSFRAVFDDFYALCRQAINPNLSEEAVERMLVQHLLTERIFRKIFNNPDFSHRNVVAAEIEKVITELTKRSLNRDDFLKKLEPFYHAIERNAENATDYTAKQDFLNTVYMRLFQGYSPKEADTHGIVYTPQPIVNFMVRSVEEILQKEFGRSLSDKGVHILDPFVGTGNFITRIMQEIKTTDLPYKYENELHCNEVMLLPYYIASMNIEHAYYERIGEYRPFPGICLVDTFELAEPKQSQLFTEANTQRVDRQKKEQIFVILGNPPYNMGQLNENDNNKNRKYNRHHQSVDNRVRDTYAVDSTATLLNKLGDPYVKAIRWASDRIVEDGVVAFITNDSFVDQIAFDGMRKNLQRDFSVIYVLDLGGNVRKNPKLSGTTHNVFGIKVGVSINLLVRSRRRNEEQKKIYYARLNEFWRKEEKYSFLERKQDCREITWEELHPDDQNNWITAGLADDFSSMMPLGSKQAKSADNPEQPVVFHLFSPGVLTARDEWLYGFTAEDVKQNVAQLIQNYHLELSRRQVEDQTKAVDDFVNREARFIKWTDRLKGALDGGVKLSFDSGAMRRALFRPFTAKSLYFDHLLNQRRYQQHRFFPTTKTDNHVIWTKIPGEWSFFALCTGRIPDYLPQGGSQCFPFYTFAQDGTHRRENITDWALEQFRSHYADPSITKWDIFHYVYAILHHPDYRQRYAANLRRELPRIPFAGATGAEALDNAVPDAGINPGSSTATRDVTVPTPALSTTVEERPLRAVSGVKKENNTALPKAVAGGRSPQATGSATEPRYERLTDEQRDSVLSEIKRMQDAGELVPTRLRYFRAFVKAGQRLAEIHVHYEQQPEYSVTKTEKKGEKLDYRVTKMKLSKDKTSLIYNQLLTLSGIPPETYEYRLGNRSALEWIIDQYQVSTDKRSGITNDPNREDDPEYILRLIGQVITVSLETVRIVKALPPLNFSEAAGR